MKNSSSPLKFFKRYFSNPIEKDGFVFEFKSITPDSEFEGAFSFIVNVVLPNPEQSYIVEVFDEMTQKIIYEAFNFIGESFSYRINLTVDGKELFPNTYTFIKKESLLNIINKINKEFSRIGITVNFGRGEINLDMDCRVSWDKIPYDTKGDNIDFFAKIELSNFESDGKPVIPNSEKKNVVAGTLYSILAERDWFVSVIEDIIYEEIIPETKIDKVDDVYVQFMFRVNRLNGDVVKQEDRYFRIQKDDFIEVS